MCRACTARAHTRAREGHARARGKDARGARQGHDLGWAARQSGEGSAAT